MKIFKQNFMMGEFGVNLTGSGQKEAAGSRERGNETWNSIKCREFVDKVRNCCLLKKDTDPGSEQVKNCEYPVQEAESTLVPKAHHVINSYITGSAVELTTSSTCSLCS